MPAAIHPGSVRHAWDHFVITLRDDAGHRSAFLSLYAIAYSASLGAGTVAFLRVVDSAGSMNAVLTDATEVAERMKKRLESMGDSEVDVHSPPIAATFVRQPFGPGGLGFTISWTSHTVEARWIDTAAPFWMIGRAPDLAANEDIWAMFVEAHGASLTFDGRPIIGEPFRDDVWVPKLGRAMSSAHVALSEVRLTPVSGAHGGATEE
jgi:hypothetical protein